MTQDLIGKTISFDAQPYHLGTARITDIQVEERDVPGGYKGYLIVTVETIDATERNRLFGAVSHQPYNGRKIRMYYYREDWLRQVVNEGKTLIYVYPV